MRILAALTWYRPYTSGLTIHAERLARALVRRGHEVTVLAMRHDPALPPGEVDGGVRIVRAPVLGRMSKGLISPAFSWHAARLLRRADILHLHLPQFDGAALAVLGRLARVPVVVTYHCDITDPPGAINKVAAAAVRALDVAAGSLAHRVVGYTRDYSEHSPFLRRFRAKLEIIPPPIELPQASPAAAREFAVRHLPPGRRPLIAMVARFSAEKGIDVLLDAWPGIVAAHPQGCIVFAGAYRDVPGEGAWFARLRPRVEALVAAGVWRFLGILDMTEMAALYANIDVLVVPSVNSTESFGLVQVEAMSCGVPVVASDLPGVRHPVRTTGIGVTFPVGDAEALARGVIDVLRRYAGRREPLPGLASEYDPLVVAARYEALYRTLAPNRP